MAEFTGNIGPSDEDGYGLVEVFTPEGTVEFSAIMRDDVSGQWLAQELAIRNAMLEAGDAECVHGMSAALCSGPLHY